MLQVPSGSNMMDGLKCLCVYVRILEQYWQGVVDKLIPGEIQVRDNESLNGASDNREKREWANKEKFKKHNG